MDCDLTVRIILENLEGKVLFLEGENSSCGSGKLCLPGGKAFERENPAHAAERGLLEETGISPRVMEEIFRQGKTLYFHSWLTGKTGVKLNEEYSAFIWLFPAEMKGYKIAFGNDDAVRRYFHFGRNLRI